MIVIDSSVFFEITEQFEITYFKQTKSYLSIYKDNEISKKVIYFADSISDPHIACLGHIKKFLGISMLLLEGVCIKKREYDSSLIKHFYEGLKSLDFSIIEINTDIKYSFEYEIGIREAGFLRPVGNFSVCLSKWIDLQEEISYNSNWKRNLKNAQSLGFEFVIKESITENEAVQLSIFYNRFASEKGFSHRLNPKYLFRLLNTPNFSVAMVLSDQGIVSFIVYHKLQKHAGLYFSARNSLEEQNGATFFMYDNLFKSLKTENYETFDMEKLEPSLSGVFRFKDSVAGQYVQYNGEWCWYRKKIYRGLMYAVKKYIFKKKEN